MEYILYKAYRDFPRCCIANKAKIAAICDCSDRLVGYVIKQMRDEKLISSCSDLTITVSSKLGRDMLTVPYSTRLESLHRNITENRSALETRWVDKVNSVSNRYGVDTRRSDKPQSKHVKLANKILRMVNNSRKKACFMSYKTLGVSSTTFERSKCQLA
jgi:hypothetical protein